MQIHGTHDAHSDESSSTTMDNEGWRAKIDLKVQTVLRLFEWPAPIYNSALTLTAVAVRMMEENKHE